MLLDIIYIHTQIYILPLRILHTPYARTRARTDGEDEREGEQTREAESESERPASLLDKRRNSWSVAAA